MMVVIPHPTEELKLIKLQKSLIADLNTAATIYVASIPLWIDFPFSDSESYTKNELKTITKSIKEITLGELQYSSNEVYIPVSIKTDAAEIKTKLSFLKLYKGADSNPALNFEQPVKKIKIFRLGIPEDLSTNSKAIKDFVWCKL